MYAVKEIFYTLQGEGANAGRAAVFCRFAGCNLWSGREQDRAKADCQFCDTDFVGVDGEGGGRFASAVRIGRMPARQVAGGGEAPRLVVLTDGEPMLQVDGELIDALHRARLPRRHRDQRHVAPVPRAIDWICVSPKAGTDLQQRSGDELKLVYPQAALDPEAVAGLAFTHRYLQPMDGADAKSQHRPRHRLLQGAPRMAPIAANRQAARYSIGPGGTHWVLEFAEKSPRDPSCASTKSFSSKPPTIFLQRPARVTERSRARPFVPRPRQHRRRARRRYGLRISLRRAGRCHGGGAGGARPSAAERNRRPREPRRSNASPCGCGTDCRTACRAWSKSRSPAIAAARAAIYFGPHRRRVLLRRGHSWARRTPPVTLLGQATKLPQSPPRGGPRARAQPAPRHALFGPLHGAGVHLAVPGDRPARFRPPRHRLRAGAGWSSRSR